MSEVGEVKLIDFRKVEAKCGLPKIEAFQTYILNRAMPGEVYEVIVSDPDTWYALRNLGDELGYEVIDARKDEDKYVVVIKIK